MTIRFLVTALSTVHMLTSDSLPGFETSCQMKPGTAYYSCTTSFNMTYQDGWAIFGKYGRAYKAFRNEQPWKEAEKLCNKEGAHLASITSAEENAFVRDVIRTSFGITKFYGPTSQSWIGGRREGGSWKWTDGSRWSYTSWDSGEPVNKGGKEDCLQIRTDPPYNESWNVYPCNKIVRYFVCEKCFF
ncbi:hypothetical protein GCK32_014310 [Trichostrongylus colubriformis]|uniref:C-type lectin domain-containing protein n=1 Tax=Trichostrongylus colubriformis TaxID=6319 RepID=A0AAN8ERR8_TRICO